MRALLICNPTASKVTPSAHRVAERALEATFDLEVVHTEAPGHGADIAREAAEAGAKAVIVYGGDGTVNEVVNGLVGPSGVTDVTLGILPGGGTNVLARTLGYPNELLDATDHLINLVEKGSVRRLNVGRLEIDGGQMARVFTFGAGLGLDADTVRLVNASGLRPRFGDWAFVYSGLRAFARLKKTPSPPLVVEAPGGPVDAWWAIVSKSDPLTYMGNRGLRLAPGASHSGDLWLTAGRQARFWRTLRWLGQAFTTGGEVRDKQCLFLPDVPDIAIEAREPVHLQADGEYLGQISSLRATTLRGALPVFA